MLSSGLDGFLESFAKALRGPPGHECVFSPEAQAILVEETRQRIMVDYHLRGADDKCTKCGVQFPCEEANAAFSSLMKSVQHERGRTYGPIPECVLGGKFKVGDRVQVVRIYDAITSLDLIGWEGVVEEVDDLDTQVNYYVSGRYLNEQMLELADE